MKKIAGMKFLAAATVAALLSVVNSAHADASLTGLNIGYGIGVVITVNPNGSLSIVNNGTAYDGGDDTLVQVINHSTGYLKSLGVSGSYILAFDGNDGIGDYTGLTGDPLGLGSPNPYYSNYGYAYSGGPGNGGNSYASPDSYFNVTDWNNGTVYWYGLGVTPGGTDYFSLEESPSFGAPTFNNVVIHNAPDSGWSIALLGTALIGLGALRRRFAVKS